MAKSIQQGVFFDQKYWTRHSKDGRALKPIYFSSLIAGNALRKCTSMYCVCPSNDDQTRHEGIVHSNGQNPATTRSIRKIDAESDCESDPTEAEEPTSVPPQDHEGDVLIRATLIPGSFAASVISITLT